MRRPTALDGRRSLTSARPQEIAARASIHPRGRRSSGGAQERRACSHTSSRPRGESSARRREARDIRLALVYCVYCAVVSGTQGHEVGGVIGALLGAEPNVTSLAPVASTALAFTWALTPALAWSASKDEGPSAGRRTPRARRVRSDRHELSRASLLAPAARRANRQRNLIARPAVVVYWSDNEFSVTRTSTVLIEAAKRRSNGQYGARARFERAVLSLASGFVPKNLSTLRRALPGAMSARSQDRRT